MASEIDPILQSQLDANKSNMIEAIFFLDVEELSERFKNVTFEIAASNFVTETANALNSSAKAFSIRHLPMLGAIFVVGKPALIRKLAADYLVDSAGANSPLER